MAEKTSTGTSAAPAAASATEQPVKSARITKIGKVVSDKMQKTIVVAVDYPRRHPLYNKTMTRTSRFKAHDENNDCKIGDTVLIEESRPLSKDKRWVLREIIERAISV
jgi:small subunit ribosomal protein S17